MKKVLFSFLFASTLIFAQNAAPTPADMAQRRVNFLTRQLTLTTAQQQQALAIFTNSATAGATVHANLKTAHQSLSDAVKANNSAGIDQAAASIGNLTAQLSANDGKADAAFYQILTPDQQAKYTQFQSQGPGRFGGSGFGRGGGSGVPHRQ